MNAKIEMTAAESVTNGTAGGVAEQARTGRRGASLRDVLIDLPDTLPVFDEFDDEKNNHRHFAPGDDRELFSVTVYHHPHGDCSAGDAAFTRYLIGRHGLAALFIQFLKRFEAEFAAVAPAHPYSGRAPEIIEAPEAVYALPKVDRDQPEPADWPDLKRIDTARAKIGRAASLPTENTKARRTVRRAV